MRRPSFRSIRFCSLKGRFSSYSRLNEEPFQNYTIIGLIGSPLAKNEEQKSLKQKHTAVMDIISHIVIVRELEIMWGGYWALKI